MAAPPRFSQDAALYPAIRAWFSTMLNTFYSTVEVRGLENVPKDQPLILCPNHGNSLTDAVVMVSTAPRTVRLTAKDTLWSIPVFGSVVHHVGTVPIQRRSEHGAAADNQSSMSFLHATLESGSAIVLFPEGISRYQPGLPELRSGVGRIALTSLLRNAEVEGYSLSIVPVAITYTAREKFRSNLLVVYAPPITLRLPDVARLCGGGAEPDIGAGAKAIMAEVDAIRRPLLVSAPDWRTWSAAGLCGRLYCNLGAQISLQQHVTLASRFATAMSIVAAEVGQEGAPAADLTGEGSGMADPSSPASKAAAAAAADPRTGSTAALLGRLPGGRASLRALKLALLRYQGLITKLSLNDERLGRPPPAHGVVGRAGMLWSALLRTAWALTLFGLSLPGALLWAPTFALVKYKERALRRVNTDTAAGTTKNMDEVTQMKMFVGTFLLPFTWCSTVALAGARRRAAALLGVPALMWITIRWLEDAFASARAAVALCRLLAAGEAQVARLRAERAGLKERVLELAVAMGMPRDCLALFPEVSAKAGGPGFSALAYFNVFSGLGRRKKDWHEVLRFQQVLAPYPTEVIRLVKEEDEGEGGGGTPLQPSQPPQRKRE